MESDLAGDVSLSLSSLQVKSQFPAAKIKLGMQSSILFFSVSENHDKLYSSYFLNEYVWMNR